MAKSKRREKNPPPKRPRKQAARPARDAAAEATEPEADSAAELPSFPIAGIGASAGGLEALSDLLKHFRTDAEIALVIVQHLAPRHESILPELLAASSRVPIVRVEDSMQ